MECPNCRFQNLPGLEHCARCGSPLRAQDIDVHPLRGTGARGAARALIYDLREQAPVLQRIREMLQTWDWSADPEPSMLRRICWGVLSVVPGLGHALSGRTRRGMIFLGAWVLSWLVAVLLLGLSPVVALSLVICVHSAAVSDAMLHRVFVPRLQALFIGLATFGMLVATLYQPAWRRAARSFELIPVAGDLRAGRLEKGDVVLLRVDVPKSGYIPGDVVCYRTRKLAGSGWISPETLLFDRILAGPGDRVRWSRGILQVNGKTVASQLRPLSNVSSPDVELEVSADSYFIYPSLLRIDVPQRLAPAVTDMGLRLQLSVVPAESVRGRVLIVAAPFWRAGEL